MSKVKVALNRESVRKILRSQEMLEICEGHANNALQKLGSGYEVTSVTGKVRCNAEVAAVSHKAKKENMENNTILKAVGGK